MNENKTDSRWQGKRYICLVRQSNDSEGTTSTEAQLALLRGEGDRLGMKHVDDVVLAGVSGSLPGNRDDLQELFDRKRRADDYDVLLVQRMDRLTRGGSSHGMWIEHEAGRVGVEILYPGDDLPEDSRYSDIVKVIGFSAAQDHARAIGQRSVQGVMHAIEQGRNSVVSQTPYGCDRLYLSATGKPLFVIRNLGDGRQQKRHPDTGAVIDTYGRVGSGSRGHYRKQKDECVTIIPGDPRKVEVVREIFSLHYNDLWGGKRIADVLNRRGVLSPRGKGWSQRQVESIYENPIYTGEALGQRVAQGIYYRRGKGKPEAVHHDKKTLATSHWAPKTKRPPTEWVWQPQPQMETFLDDALREKANAQIKQLLEERWQRSQDPARPKRSTSKHKASEYILTGVLVAKQDGGELTGVLCGRRGAKVRYYRHRRGRTGYRKGNVYNKMIRAEPLEDAVLGLIREAVRDVPAVRTRIREAVEAAVRDAQGHGDLNVLRQERDALIQRVQEITRVFDAAMLRDAQPEIDRIKARRAELEKLIGAAESVSTLGDIDPEELADVVVAQLASAADLLAALTPTTKRELIEAFVDRIEVDMETKDAAVVLKLPSWALEAGSAMRLAPSSRSQTSYETHPVLRVTLGYADCRYTLVSSRVCYACRRREAA